MMTIKQRILKTAYPLIMWLSGLRNKEEKMKINTAMKEPPESIYTTNATSITNSTFSMASLKGKKILLVNTASDCGYTNQYGDLEKLYQSYNGKLVILGFPANDFKEQEKGSDEDIASFL